MEIIKEFLILIVSIFGFAIESEDNTEKLEVENNDPVEQVEKTNDQVMESVEAIVKHVIDGDTLVVEYENRETEVIRLLNIDTPELDKNQKFAKEAKEFTKNIENELVVVEKGEQDKYGRTLAYVFVDGILYNKTLAESGYARVAFRTDPNTIPEYLKTIEQGEKRAIETKKNIWSIPGYVTDYGFNQ